MVDLEGPYPFETHRLEIAGHHWCDEALLKLKACAPGRNTAGLESNTPASTGVLYRHLMVTRHGQEDGEEHLSISGQITAASCEVEM